MYTYQSLRRNLFSFFFSFIFLIFLIFFCRCLIKADRTKDLSDEGQRGYAFSIVEIVRDPIDTSKSRALRTHIYWADTELERDEWVTVLQKYAGASIHIHTHTHAHTSREGWVGHCSAEIRRCTLHMCVCVCVCVRIWIWIYYMYAYMYTCMYVYVYVYA